MSSLNEDLIDAAERGYLEEVRRLLDKGADVNARNDWWETPLHHAANGGHLSVVKLLVERGADINARDINGWTPLHYAAQNGYLDVIEFLVEKGADVDAKNKDGGTPLDLAKKKKHWDIVNFLDAIRKATVEIIDIKHGPLSEGLWGKISVLMRGSGKVKVDLEGDVEWIDPGEININGEDTVEIPVKPKVNGEVPVKITVKGGKTSISKMIWLNVNAQGRAEVISAGNWIDKEIEGIRRFLREIEGARLGLFNMMIATLFTLRLS
ncbi:MAG: ankyrin repeat domain-containing protein [Thaumarchaeota archaeon]|nr:ankyrin repeat domain-containing protein [Candidatus Geocrenenecus arthurdayi]